MTERDGLYSNAVSGRLPKEKLDTFSLTGLLSERSSLDKLVTILYGQLAGTVSDDKSAPYKNHTGMTYLLEQHCSDLLNYGLTDSASITVDKVRKEVDCSSADNRQKVANGVSERDGIYYDAVSV